MEPDPETRRLFRQIRAGVKRRRVRRGEEESRDAIPEARYRRRFRIESSYRLLETGRGRTSSREEGLRLWYVVLAMLLVNQWLQLRREASRRWGRGEPGRCWCLELLTVLAQILLETPAAPDASDSTQAPVPQ